MKRDALLRQLRTEARIRGVKFEVEKDAGKGSHYVVFFADKSTVIKSGELSPLYVKIVKKQLGV
ncbi:hypothetical protein [Bartonella sp. DGB2]|uniref:hypothetical protein n=1 Tax=Bartonella sp. DGB2 TaxID=3388426 RepID=UPI0039901440